MQQHHISQEQAKEQEDVTSQSLLHNQLSLHDDVAKKDQLLCATGKVLAVKNIYAQ